MSRTVFPSIIHAVLQAAERLGADRAALLEAVGLNDDALADREQRVPVEQLFALYRLGEAQTGCADLGLYCGRVAYVNGLNVQLYMSTICASFRDYLNLIPSMLRLHGDIGEVRVRRDGDEIGLGWHPLQQELGHRHWLSDCILGMSALIVDSLCVEPIKPLRAQFSYPAPDDTRLLQQLFACPLLFDQPHSELVFAREVLRYPVVQLDYAFSHSMISSVQRLFDELPDDDAFVTRVRESMQRLLPTGDITVDSVAGELHISRRTLQRHLAERDTQFQQLLQTLRHQLARRYLDDARLGITEIALLLGYADHGSFSSAFKSWQGMTPSEFRQR